MNGHPDYGSPRAVTPWATVLLEDNPGHMTLDGTNTWLLRAPGSAECVVVDPGEDDRPHLERVLAAAGRVGTILITHEHHDHVGGAGWLAERTGAPVRAFSPRLCAGGGVPLSGGEVIDAAGLRLLVVHTPGHTEDSVCLLVRRGDEAAMLTGDTVLGRGTTVVSDLGDYLDSLRLLAAQPAGLPVLPGHGPELPDLAEIAGSYLRHREQRLDQVRAALRALGPEVTARQVVEHVYTDVDPVLWGPAEWSVRAQLDYLRRTTGPVRRPPGAGQDLGGSMGMTT